MTAISNSALGDLFASGLFATENKFQDLFDSHINRLGDSMLGVLDIIPGSIADPGLQFLPQTASSSNTIGFFRRDDIPASVFQQSLVLRNDSAIGGSTQERFPLIISPFGVGIGGSISGVTFGSNTVALIISGQTRFGAGTAGFPGAVFSSNVLTGFFYEGADPFGSNANIGISLDGTEVARWAVGSTFGPQLQLIDGSAGGPAYSFTSENDTGAYLSAAGLYSVAIGGAQVMTVSAGGASLSSQFSTPAGTAGAPGYTFNADGTTGMYLSGTGVLAFSASGDVLLTLASGMLDAQSNKIIMIADGTNAGDAVNKGQLDSVAAGLNPKESSEVATTTTLDTVGAADGTGDWTPSGSGVNKMITASSAGLTNIDGVELADDDRVLVKDENGGGSNLTAVDNGIYVVETATASVAAATVLTRALDFDGTPGNEVGGGDTTFIISGSVNAGTGWVVVGGSDIVVDASDIEFTQFSGAGAVSLAGLSDTTIVSASTNDTLIFNAGSWENRTAPEARAHHRTGENHDDGSASSVAIGFSSEAGLGIFRASAGVLSIASGSTEVVSFSGAGTGQILMPDGTAADPSYTFNSETDAGAYLSAAGHWSVAIGGTQVMTVSAGGVSLSSQFSGTDATAGAPTYSFNSDPDTGMYLAGTGVLAFSASGDQVLRASSAAIVFEASQLLAQRGIAGAPSYSFESDPNQGMYRNLSTGDTTFCDSVSQDRLSIGSTRLRFSTLTAIANAGSESAPAYGFAVIGDTNTGMYHNGMGIVALTAAGSTMFQCDNGSSVTVIAPLVPGADLTFDLGASSLRWNRVHASTFDGVSTTAAFADLAERYEADQEYEPGTVVIVGGAKEITQSQSVGDDRVLGIISANPGFAMNEKAGTDKTHPYVALSGRVPCKVKGPIYKGQRLVSSSAVGHAEGKSHPTAGTTIGLALEDFPDSAKGVIEVTIKRC